ncbi:hypothetical protein Btru_069067 [Bulinus truncatus]|nr:hypothetical protein Btru_069067 [Bulinus truncatus]
MTFHLKELKLKQVKHFSCTRLFLTENIKMATIPRLLIVQSIGRRYFSGTAQALSQESPVGFVGLGNMGGHMARNLLKKGYPVIAYDVSKDALASLKNEGANVADSPAEVAANVSRLVSMLPASAEVQEVYGGKKGILSTVKKGTLMLDSSTIDPSVSQEVAAQSQKQGAVFMDSPVSGGVNAARDGILTFMVGGPESSFAQAKALLDNMGRNVVYCGPVGTGQVSY